MKAIKAIKAEEINKMNDKPVLSFDGRGINSTEGYAERIATFNDDYAVNGAKYGNLFASAPELLKELNVCLDYIARHHDEDMCDCSEGLVYCKCATAEFWRSVRSTIAHAEGK